MFSRLSNPLQKYSVIRQYSQEGVSHQVTYVIHDLLQYFVSIDMSNEICMWFCLGLICFINISKGPSRFSQVYTKFIGLPSLPLG